MNQSEKHPEKRVKMACFRRYVMYEDIYCTETLQSDLCTAEKYFIITEPHHSNVKQTKRTNFHTPDSDESLFLDMAFLAGYVVSSFCMYPWIFRT